MQHKLLPPILLGLTLSAASTRARAESSPSQPRADLASRGTAFETNVLWPFFPGGIVDFKVAAPIGPGYLVAGIYSDFAWRFIRDETYGRVFAMGTKLAWRQMLVGGIHVEAQLQLNWRHEEDRPDHPDTLDGFQGRAWFYAGYQRDLGRRAYINSRVGIGIHMFRTDELGDAEKKFAPAADLNLGIRF